MNHFDAIKQIEEDMADEVEPFSSKMLPEKAALREVSVTDQLAFLSYGVMLDYNRNAKQLWNNCLELYNSPDEGFFYPDAVALNHSTPDDIADTFKDIGFRYPNRDAKGWWTNSRKIHEHYEGSWAKLIQEASSMKGAPSLVELLRDDNFLYLKGKKLAPFYAKVVDANVVNLDNIWQLDIPVDTHIRRLTIDLAGVNMTDDEIRNFWERIGTRYDIDPMVVDTALWLIGNNWNDWGKSYWTNIVDHNP